MKVGDYVRSICDTDLSVYKVIAIDGNIATLEDIAFGYDGVTLGSDLMFLRPAYVLNYIRTLDADRMTKLLNTSSNCCYCYCGCGNKKMCPGDCQIINCKDGIRKWLDQPLTDKIINLLKGDEENE